MHREPKVPEARVPIEERFDCPARITSKELAPIHSVKNGILQYACSTSRRKDAHLVKRCPYVHRQVEEQPSKMSTKNGNKSAVAMSKNIRQLGCLFHDMEPPNFTSILRKSSDIRKPIRCVRFTKVVLRRTKIRDQNPSFGYICPGEPHQRSPNAPKFEDRSQEEIEWQERCAREAAWRLAKSILKKEKKQHSSHLREIGACLHLILNLKNENLLSTSERRCTWSAKRTWVTLKWILWRSRVVLR